MPSIQLNMKETHQEYVNTLQTYYDEFESLEYCELLYHWSDTHGYFCEVNIHEFADWQLEKLRTMTNFLGGGAQETNIFGIHEKYDDK